MSLLLCCVTEERPYLGIMIIIYLPSINQICTAHCVYYLFFLPCSFCTSSPATAYYSRRAAWIHICFPLFTYYCIIDGDALYVALERTCVTIFHWLLFVYFSGKTLIHLGHFLLFSSEWDYSTIQIINTLPSFIVLSVFSRYLERSTRAFWASMQSEDFDCHYVRILIKSIGSWNKGGTTLRPFPPFFYIVLHEAYRMKHNTESN